MSKKAKLIIFITVLITMITIVSAILIHDKNKAEIAAIQAPDYYSLLNFNYEFEENQLNEFYTTIYEWYKSIENKDGVYIINTDYYDDDLLEEWNKNNIYNTIPDKPFWYFTASPSYIKKIGINLTQRDIDDAQKGVRIYMLPDTLSSNEIQKMTAYLKEDALKNASQGAVPTNFTKSKEVKIITYTPNKTLFTWPSDKKQSLTETAPIIFVCTAQNMKYFESESLAATGVDSYIKFRDKKIMEKLTHDDNIKQYNLSFSPSSEIYKQAGSDRLVDKGIDNCFNKNDN